MFKSFLVPLFYKKGANVLAELFTKGDNSNSTIL